MTYLDEDEGPCIHHRSAFDTIPAPPMFPAASEPTMLSARAVPTLVRRSSAREEHGLSRTGEYRSWGMMWNRCTNPNNHRWQYYGGKGVRVCDRWRTFTTFLSDMGPRPEGTTLDRIDVSGDYEPGNCRWADANEQAQNSTHTRWIEFRGRRMCLTDWAKELGITRSALRNRLGRHRLDIALSAESLPCGGASLERTLSFIGGDVDIPKPTRADLVLSAQQWATRAREELFELANNATSPENRLTGYRAITGALNRLDAVLAELAAL